MKLSKSLFAALSSLCVLNACSDWTSFTANDCSQDEGAKIFDNAYYICDEFNHWKQIIPKCKPGETRLVELNNVCYKQECNNRLNWPTDEETINTAPTLENALSCISKDSFFTQIGECLNGRSSCDEEGANTNTPYRICSNGQRFEFGACGCDSSKGNSCANVNKGTGVTCINDMLKTCILEDTGELVSCLENTGQCGECLNGDIRCDGDMLKTCQNGKWKPTDDVDNKCSKCIPGESKCTNIEYNAVQICNDNGEWVPQFCEADQTCGNKDNAKDNTCIPKNEFKCKDDQNCYNLDPSKPICDTNSGQCVECNDGNCKAIDETKPICNTESRQCVECNDNTNCNDSSKPICNKDGQCVECSDDNCKAIDETKPICNTESRQCVECNDNTNCNDSSKPICNEAGQCVPCNNDTQCKEGKVCDEGKCVEKCTESSCDNQICNPQTGQCVECIDDEQCSENGTLNICNNGKCVECTGATDCKDQNKPICNSTGTCARCDYDSNQCEKGKVCEIESGQCIECNKSNFDKKICVWDKEIAHLCVWSHDDIYEWKELPNNQFYNQCSCTADEQCIIPDKPYCSIQTTGALTGKGKCVQW